MPLSLILLLFYLWGNVGVSLSVSACSQLPVVLRAHVPEEAKKTEYNEGDVIQFTCDPGYTSHQPSKFVCTRRGWLTIRQGTCYSCSTLPDVPHAHVSEETTTAEYQVGHVIRFTCEAGYTSDVPIKYVCLEGGWLALHDQKCYFQVSGCENPPSIGQVTIKGLPDNEEPILPDHVLVFSCDRSDQILNGSSVLVCGKDGQWNHPLPTCKDKCRVTALPQGVRIISQHAPGDMLNIGERLEFGCSRPGHLPQGRAEVECLENGHWSHPFPTCGLPTGCARPPILADGETKLFPKLRHRHGERVEYMCQSLYKMKGPPYFTCFKGEWRGDLRCLKPCTIDEELMARHNIAVKYSYEKKLYAPHEDRITFTCTTGKPVGGVGMRQQCLDGEMLLPTCQ